MSYNFGMSTQLPLPPPVPSPLRHEPQELLAAKGRGRVPSHKPGARAKRLFRQIYKHFYNRFAFTYDPVSAIVSRGEWRAWTRAAIPFVRKEGQVLEIAFGTGNLLLDLFEAGLKPVGVDLSPYMIGITRRKLRARSLSPSILRAAVQQLPFPTAHFDSIVMTFPPGFITDPRAMKEMQRVLADDGSLIWVDAPYLKPRDAWSRFLNWAYSVTGGAPEPRANEPLSSTYEVDHAGPAPFGDWLPQDDWCWNVQRIERQSSLVHVIIGTKLDRREA
jgi:ubiquinone/menaquinone biosynthesis C-methylase UbiE